MKITKELIGDTQAFYMIQEGGWHRGLFSPWQCEEVVQKYPGSVLAIGAEIVRGKFLRRGRAA